MTSLFQWRRSYFHRSIITHLRPHFRKPRVRILRHIHIGSFAVILCYPVTSQIVKSILLIRPCADSIRHSLLVIANLLVYDELHVTDLGVLDPIFVAVVGVDDPHPSPVDRDDVLDRRVAFGLVQTVAAGLVEAPEVFGEEACDVVFASELDVWLENSGELFRLVTVSMLAY